MSDTSPIQDTLGDVSIGEPWLLGIYMDASTNDLEAAMRADIAEIQGALADCNSDDLTVWIQVDLPSGTGLRIRMKKSCREVERTTESPGLASFYSAFIQATDAEWCDTDHEDCDHEEDDGKEEDEEEEERPFAHRMFVMWGHGSGVAK